MCGIAQKAQEWSHPSLIFRYEVWRVSDESTRSGRSMLGTRSSMLGEHPSLAQLGDEPFHVRQAEEEIHLGNVLAQLILVALNHASDSHHGLRPAGFLVGARLEDRLNGTAPSRRR